MYNSCGVQRRAYSSAESHGIEVNVLACQLGDYNCILAVSSGTLFKATQWPHGLCLLMFSNLIIPVFEIVLRNVIVISETNRI